MSGRFEAFSRSLFDDGCRASRSCRRSARRSSRAAQDIITRNESPDISFDRSINPYRGCEHGCSYCYARPAHSYMGLSPGLDFESKLFAKPNAAELLRAELSAKTYQPRTIALGANTDCLPTHRARAADHGGVLEVLSEFNHPVGIVTKSALVTRDIDILAPMGRRASSSSRCR